MQKLLMLLLLLMLGATQLEAQHDLRLAATKTPINEVERLQLPPQNNKNLLTSELARRAPGIAPRFAEVIPVDVSPETHGSWEVNHGIAIWRLVVPSPGAKSLNFGFDQFLMPAGGSLILYTPDLKIVRGPFTPADNEEHEELWTPVIPGDELVIELSLPLDQKDNFKLHLKTVNHDFLGFSKSLLSGSCNIDVVCGLADGYGIVDQYRDIIQSVAVISTGGNTFCTGFLVSNVREDCTPFFMTANHCGIGPGNAASLVTYWNFQNRECREPGFPESGGVGDGVLDDFNTGAIHRASYSPADATLVELDDPVSETANAWFAGWDATENLEQDTLICVHHPSTDEKRISFQFEGVYRGNWETDATPVPDGDHLIIEDWNLGTTEGGSSGSPLFDSEKRVVGQLHGGFASCNNPEFDTYGWFHSSWIGGGTPSTRLSDWLDPDNTGTLVIDGREQLQCSFLAEATPSQQSLCSGVDANYNISVTESFIAMVSLSLDGLPSGLTATFNQTMVAPGGTTTLTITGTSSLPSGTYSFDLIGNDGTNSSTQNLTLNITNAIPNAPVLLSPLDMAMGQSSITTLSWEAIEMATSYQLELALDASFTNIVTSQTNLTGSEFLAALDVESNYYWRVRATNICGEGEWSQNFSFNTGAVTCAMQNALDLPIQVGPSGSSIAISEIEISVNGLVSSVRVVDLDIKHSWVGDLNSVLTSPAGTSVNLFSTSGCEEDNIFVSFDDGALQSNTDFQNNCNPGGQAVSGSFQPTEPLNTFVGEGASGTWTLSIYDNENGDGGQIDAWNLDFCTAISADASIGSSIQNTTVCTGDELMFDLTLGSGFIDEVQLSAMGLPTGAMIDFGDNPFMPGSVVSLNALNLIEAGNYTVNIIANDGANEVSTSFNLTIEDAPNFTALTIPIDQAVINNNELVNFSWEAIDNATSYTLEVASDDAFSNLVLNIDYNETSTILNLEELGLNTGQYYWRVTTMNECGGSVSGFNTFQFNLVGTQEIGAATLDIHPNPTTGLLQVSLSGGLGTGDLIIDVFAASGQKMANWRLTSFAGTQEINLSSLPSGVYWFNISSGEYKAIEKIVLIK